MCDGGRGGETERLEDAAVQALELKEGGTSEQIGPQSLEKERSLANPF